MKVTAHQHALPKLLKVIVTGEGMDESVPKVKMNPMGLFYYARDRAISVRDLIEEEKNQFGLFSIAD